MEYLCISILIILLYFCIRVNKLIEKQNNLNMVLADFQAPIDRINVAITGIASEITDLKNSLASKLSTEDETVIVNQLADIATKLESITANA